MYASPMLMNGLSHAGSTLMGTMGNMAMVGHGGNNNLGHHPHHSHHAGNLGNMISANPTVIPNDIPEEDLPLPKFHEVFSFVLQSSKSGLKRGIAGVAGGKHNSHGTNPNATYDSNKRGKMEHNPGEETSG